MATRKTKITRKQSASIPTGETLLYECKKFTISRDKLQYIVRFSDKQDNWYYSDMTEMVNGLIGFMVSEDQKAFKQFVIDLQNIELQVKRMLDALSTR